MCAHPDCFRSPNHFGCAVHWRELPLVLRNAIENAVTDPELHGEVGRAHLAHLRELAILEWADVGS